MVIKNSENEDRYSHTSTWPDQQARQFTDDHEDYHDKSDENDGREF